MNNVTTIERLVNLLDPQANMLLNMSVDEAIAYALGVGFVPVRKLGKLPSDVVSVEYDLEYGSATLEMHKDAIAPGARVLIVDDLLATGGTVAGTIELVKQLQGEIVALAFLIELKALRGRDRLHGYDIATLIEF